MNTAGRVQTSGNHLVDAGVDLLDLGGLAGCLVESTEMAFRIDMFCPRGRIYIAPLMHVELAPGGLLSSTRPAWRTNAFHVHVLNYRKNFHSLHQDDHIHQLPLSPTSTPQLHCLLPFPPIFPPKPQTQSTARSKQPSPIDPHSIPEQKSFFFVFPIQDNYVADSSPVHCQRFKRGLCMIRGSALISSKLEKKREFRNLTFLCPFRFQQGERNKKVCTWVCGCVCVCLDHWQSLCV
jgi:hypothetical protein